MRPRRDRRHDIVRRGSDRAYRRISGGLFGKGGSAIATPLLAAVGVPAIIAVAAPLPATIPSTLAASSVYWKARLIDWHVVRWSLGFGIPATAIGAAATHWIGGYALVTITDVILVVLGVRFLFGGGRNDAEVVDSPRHSPWLLAIVATAVGFISGMLANGGAFLLAPVFIAVLRLPVKAAFVSSLAVAAVLAVPGTIVHAALGHIDWVLNSVFAATSVPLSFLGARVALRTKSERLERIYGAAISLLGITFLIARQRGVHHGCRPADWSRHDQHRRLDSEPTIERHPHRTAAASRVTGRPDRRGHRRRPMVRSSLASTNR